MGKAYRVFREGFPHHTFTRGINGNVIFFALSDCLYFTTLFCCLAQRFKISVRGFSIMPNHVHSNETAPDKKSFLLFHCRLNSEFTHEYNSEHGRKGPLLDKRFGYAPKTSGKRIRDNLCYIANNATVGNLSKDILEYRWNLLAYRQSDHPFSEEIDMKHSSRAMKRALKMVSYFRDNDLPFNYARQRLLMKNLSLKEKRQLVDYIITRYNCLDYAAMESFYQDSFEQACISFRANSGSEHDIPEDHENYGIYAKMTSLARKEGIDLKRCNFEAEKPDVIYRLFLLGQELGFPIRQLHRFLHTTRIAQLPDNN